MKKYLPVFVLLIISQLAFAGNVFVNQVGYLNVSEKYFYTDVSSDSFYVIEKQTGIVFYSNEIFTSVQNDPATGLNLYAGDFTFFERPGTYYIKTNAGDTSFYFDISIAVFENTFKSSLKAFYFQRCGTALLEANAGVYYHAPCHITDGYFHTTTNQSGYKATSGGWHDAGDYGKYIVNAGISAGTLLMAYESFPEKFNRDDLNIPESGNGIPDILDEVRYELDWFLKIQRDDGGVYFKLTRQQFAAFVMPNNDTGIRYIYQVSSTATGDFVAVMAKAARIYKNIDSAFAHECLNAALLGWNYLSANTSIVPAGGFTNPSGTGTGQYGDNNDSDERLWASAELFETTGETEYNNFFNSHYNQTGNFTSTQWWGNVKNLALLTYQNSSQTSASSSTKSQLKTGLITYCNSLVGRCSNNGFGVTINPGEYSWGCNSDILNKALLLIYGYKAAANFNYYSTALTQLNYILGTNAHNFSFVTGSGTNSVMHPHHRPSGSDGIIAPVPGLLAGGPDQYLDDPSLQAAFNTSTPPALCYLDNINSYASNEIAINWNAPLVFVLGYFNNSVVSDVKDRSGIAVPNDFKLEQNYPNPFNPSTTLKYNLAKGGFTTLRVYDLLGNVMERIVEGYQEAGGHSALFDAARLASGIYFYTLKSGEYMETKKMVLIR